MKPTPNHNNNLPQTVATVSSGLAAAGDGAGLLIHRLENVHPGDGGTVARCPACAEDGHDKTGNHLFIHDDGRFGCVKFAGQEGADHRKRIFALAGETTAPRQTAPRRTPQKTVKRVQTWTDAQTAAEACKPRGYSLTDVYSYERNRAAFGWVARYDPEGDGKKRFLQFHPEGGRVAMGAPAGDWPLYPVDDLGEGPVCICEGEKSCHAALSIGLNATTSAGGSSAAGKSDWRPTAGRDVVILADNDKDGEKYASKVAGILLGLGCTVRILRLPDLPEAGDIFDYIEQHPETTAEDVELMAATVAPETAPDQVQTDCTSPTETAAADGLSPIEAAQAGAPYACTDLGNAERFAFMHRDSVKFDTARGVWLVWDGRRFKPDATLEVNARAAETARAIRLEAAAVPTDGDQGRNMAQDLFRHAMRSESRDRLSAMLEVAKAQPGLAVAADDLDANPFLLNCENGTLDLVTGTLKPHDKADLLTKLAPTPYHAGKVDPRLVQFLEDATGGDTELQRFIQKLCGYILTGDTREEKIFFLFGGANTGKSTLLESMRGILGDYAKTINPAMLCKQNNTNSGAATPELAALQGCRLAAGSELESGQQLGEAFMKNLTGGEGVTARHLYGRQFEFMVQFKIVLAMNHCPKASADDGAVWRRIVRVGIDKAVPQERIDRTLKPYLRDPKRGGIALLAWAVEGCLAWQREGLDPMPDAVRTNTEAYRTECDPLATFIEDCIELTPYAWTAASAILDAYREHCDEMGIPERYRVSPRRLAVKLRDIGGTSERRHEGRGWLGIELKGGEA